MKKRYLVLGLSLTLLFSGLSVSAAEFIFPEKEGGSVVINEELENVYTAGSVVSINSNIGKGLHAGGNAIIVKGDVSGTVYAGGGSVFIEGTIEDDLFIGGGDVTLTETSSVKGDLIAGVGKITIDGPIGGNILLGGAEVVINSKVAGNVKINADNLEFGDNAEIAGNLEYTAKEESKIDKSKVLGEVIFHQKKAVKAGLFKNPKVFLGLLTLSLLLRFLSVIAVGLIFVYLLKRFTGEVVKESLQKFWPNLGIGFGLLASIPVVCIILTISVIGLWVAGIIGALYVLLLILSSVFASIILGTWLIKIITKKQEYIIDWKAVVVGMIAIKFLMFIPFIGWLAKFIFFLIALGALAQWIYRKLA